MQFITLRELSKSPREALAKLDWGKNAILTNNGKPQALMIKIDEDSFEEKLEMINRIEAMQNINEIRLESIRNGTWGMNMDEINIEIKAAREERKRKNNNA